MMLEAPAGFEVARHTHPGVEPTLIMEGELTLEVQGQATRTMCTGDGFQVPANTPCAGCVGNARS